MKREIHYYYYPGCLVIALSIENEPGEDYKWVVKDVAKLYDPRYKKHGKWMEAANLLTAEERDNIKKNAYDNLCKYIKWSFNPNHDKNISDIYVNEMSEKVISLLKGNYDIT